MGYQPQDPEPWEWEKRLALWNAEVGDSNNALDLGCGAGRFVRKLSQRNPDRSIGLDVAKSALTRARANVPSGDFRLIGEDGTFPLEHNSIDFVWCSEVLGHVADTSKLRCVVYYALMDY